MLADLDAAQGALTSQLAELRGADTQHLHLDMLAMGGAKLLQLGRLRDQLVSGAKDVNVLRGAVASAVADIRAYTSEARTATATVQGATSEQTASVTLLAASEAARTTANGFIDEYYKRRIFDPYLTFASVQDEEEFRRREEERERAIDKAQAQHTPEGDLLADQLAIDQMKDAGAHGATRSPEFQKRLDKLTASKDALTAALARAPNTAPQAATDPFAAAKPAAHVPPELAANLRASGIVLPDQNGTGHGVNASAASSVLGRT